MEPLFEVRFYGDKKTITEYARKHLTGPRFPMLIVFGWYTRLF